jgi:hypothetical protein
MVILIVDDEQAGSIATALAARVRVFFDRETHVRLADVVPFDRACDAIHWLTLGCPLAYNTREPVLSREPPAELVEYKQVPDVAVIDIDFDFERERDEWPSENPQPDPSGRRSARLGWPVASKLRELADQHRSPCEIILYTGKGDVIAGLGEACKALEWRGGSIAPFVRVEPKTVEIDQISKLVKRGLNQAARRRVDRFGLNVTLADQFYQMAIPYDLAATRRLRQLGRREIVKRFRPLFELLPWEASEFLALAGETSRIAADTIIRFCSDVDLHLELQRCFKTLRRPGRGDYFATPLAAARHNSAWDYRSDEPGPLVDEHGHRCLFDRLDAQQWEEQQRNLQDWFENDCLLPEDIKDRIRAEAQGQLLTWANTFNAVSAKPNWESSFSEQLPRLLDRLHPDHRQRVRLNDPISHRELLTDWVRFFGSDVGSRAGVFQELIEISVGEGAVRIEFETVDHPATGTELVVSVMRGDSDHVGSEAGFRGTTINDRLKHWGSSWYRVSVPPKDGESTARIVRIPVWPASERRDEGPAVQPVIELHWQVPDYMTQREVD